MLIIERATHTLSTYKHRERYIVLRQFSSVQFRRFSVETSDGGEWNETKRAQKGNNL